MHLSFGVICTSALQLLLAISSVHAAPIAAPIAVAEAVADPHVCQNCLNTAKDPKMCYMGGSC